MILFVIKYADHIAPNKLTVGTKIQYFLTIYAEYPHLKMHQCYPIYRCPNGHLLIAYVFLGIFTHNKVALHPIVSPLVCPSTAAFYLG